MKSNIVLGVHALRSGSGGAFNHLKHIFSDMEPWQNGGFSKVIIFTNNNTRIRLPKHDSLKVIVPSSYFHSTIGSYFYEIFLLPVKLKRLGVNVMFYTDASVIATFKPNVVLSRDMLSFEDGIREYYSGFKRIRIDIIGLLQKSALTKSNSPAFLNDYAKQKILPKLKRYAIVPHGFEEEYKEYRSDLIKKFSNLKICYTSNSAPYKGHFELIIAFREFLRHDKNAELHLVGVNSGSYIGRITELIASVGIMNSVYLYDTLNHEELFEFYNGMDLFVFSSKCENMPNTLLEAVRCGIPVISSCAGPMKEMLGDYKYQYDPNNSDDILFKLLDFRENFNRRDYDYLYTRFSHYSWTKTRDMTIKIIQNVLN